MLHVIETIAPHEGGPPRVVAGLAGAQRAAGIDAQVFCGDGNLLPANLRYWREHAPEFRDVAVHTACASSNGIVARAQALRAWLRANLANYDVIHIHGLWRLVPTLAAFYARQVRTPYLIAPHTALAPWALAQKRPKKMLARMVVWNGLFKSAAGFHALNDLEAEEITVCVGPTGPPAYVVPNGISLLEFPDQTAATPMPRPASLPVSIGSGGFVLFLARLHTMKGPDLLLEAFATIATESRDVQLVFAGPDYGMLALLRHRAAELQLSDRVHFLGQVSGASKLWLLRSAVCLCQPSRCEGFSLSILEAMASSRPVVISEWCKFPEVATHGAGIVVPMTIGAIASGLRVYTHDATRRVADGQAARQLIARDYTWGTVSRQTEQMYSQVAKQQLQANARDHSQ